MATRPRLKLDEPGPDLNPWEGATEMIREQRRKAGGAEQDAAVRAMTLRAFAERVPESRGPLLFNRFTYQAELYDERAAMDREQVVMKANQVGESTKSIRLAMYHANRGATVLYTMPTSVMLGKFSQRRLAPIIKGSDYLRSRIPSSAVQNVSQKQVGWGWIEFRGTEVAIEEIDADLMVVDEYDFSDQGNIEQSERRISGPMSQGMIRRLSIPTVPNFGIAEHFERTDQRIWTVKCSSCNTWNPIEGYEAFRVNVDQERKLMVCRDCRKPIDVRRGTWVPKYPDRDVRGYHIPKLIVHGTQLEPIILNSKKTAPLSREAFYRRDLGIPYAPAEGMLSLEQLRRCMRRNLHLEEALATTNLTTMGVDQASSRPLNVTIEEDAGEDTTRVVYAARVEDVPGGRSALQQLSYLMQAFNVNMAGIDNGPDGRFARRFAELHPGRVWRMGYFTPQPSQKKEPEAWYPDEEQGFCSLWRLKLIDTVLERFRLQRVLIPDLDEMPERYAKEMGSIVRQSEKTDAGNVHSFYRSTGPDDFVHSHVYNIAARYLFWLLAGRQELLGQGPVPLADSVSFERSELADYGDEPDYFAGPGGSDFFDDDPFSP